MSSALGYCIFVVFIVHNIGTKRVIGSECPAPEAILPCRCLPKGSEYQVWCSHSDLPKVLDGLHAVAQNITTSIDELILENNYLPSLPGRTFLPLKVVRLMVRQNALERVSSDWLAGLDSVLMELFIVEPKLRYLPDDSISQLNSLEAITIQTNSLKRLPRISSLQKLRYLQLESISLVDLSMNFRSLPSLKNFQISGSPKLRRLEANFLKDLPSLESVNISNCGINWLHPRAFSNLPRLKLLSLTGNKITDAGMIGRGAKDLISLKTLYLDYNYINKLTEGSFVDLPHLEVLHLSNNNIIEIYHGAFHRVPRLKSLYLNWNVLRRVHPESFLQQSGSGLEELWLIHNDIAHITELKSLLDALPRLTFLDMSYNKLEIIPFGSLRGHPTLEVFKLNHNRLFRIDKESFMAMPALRELEMRNNSLSNFDGEPLWNLPSLKGLDVSYNYYRRLEPSFLVNLPSLRKFDLSGNQLVAINPMAFVVTPEIEYINISFNGIQHIHPATFVHLLNLYELDIRYNQLSEFVSGLPPVIEHLHLQNNKIKLFPILFEKRTMLSLRMLDMSTNLLDHIPPYTLKHFAKLKKLSVDDNYIYRLEGGAFEGLSFLEILNIRNNKITHIHPDAFKGVLNLIELNLSNNNLETILPSTFQDMKNLKKLDVSRNKLADFLQGMLDTALDLLYI